MQQTDNEKIQKDMVDFFEEARSRRISDILKNALTIGGQTLYVDIDGVLCESKSVDTDGELDYSKSVPYQSIIDMVNALYENNTIVLFTARGARTGKIDWKEFTEKQMNEWGVRYHQLRMDKPHFDMLIDDKSVSSLHQYFLKPVTIGAHIHGCMAVRQVGESGLFHTWDVLEVKIVPCDFKGNVVPESQFCENIYAWYEMPCIDPACPAKRRINAMCFGLM